MRQTWKWLATFALVVSAVAVIHATSYAETWGCADSDNLDCDVDWTEVQGDLDIAFNVGTNGAGGFAKTLATAPTLSSAEQYGLVTIRTTGGNAYDGLCFRITDSSSPYYELVFQTFEQLISWNMYSNAADTTAEVLNAGQAVTINDTDAFGVTITGTGTSTIIRVWRNPTGSVTAADNWNGDTTPDLTFTDDPASPVNTGNMAGFSLYANSAGNANVDNITLGDTPTGGSTFVPRILTQGVGELFAGSYK
jgi:hypothetical protein